LNPVSPSNCDIRCGVIGISKIPIPHGASASETALSTAAGGLSQVRRREGHRLSRHMDGLHFLSIQN
jgi:hypothetical protein